MADERVILEVQLTGGPGGGGSGGTGPPPTGAGTPTSGGGPGGGGPGIGFPSGGGSSGGGGGTPSGSPTPSRASGSNLDLGMGDRWQRPQDDPYGLNRGPGARTGSAPGVDLGGGMASRPSDDPYGLNRGPGARTGSAPGVDLGGGMASRPSNDPYGMGGPTTTTSSAEVKAAQANDRAKERERDVKRREKRESDASGVKWTKGGRPIYNDAGQFGKWGGWWKALHPDEEEDAPITQYNPAMESYQDWEVREAKAQERAGNKGGRRRGFFRSTGAAVEASVRAGQASLNRGNRLLGSAGAALRAGGSVIGAAMGGAMGGLIGSAVADSFVGGVRLFARAVGQMDEAANKLGEVSGVVAEQMARGEIRRFRTQIRRARQIGPEVAEYIDARGQLGQQISDFMTELMDALGGPITDVMEYLADLLNIVNAVLNIANKFWDLIYPFISHFMNFFFGGYIMSLINWAMDKIFGDDETEYNAALQRFFDPDIWKEKLEGV